MLPVAGQIRQRFYLLFGDKRPPLGPRGGVDKVSFPIITARRSRLLPFLLTEKTGHPLGRLRLPVSKQDRMSGGVQHPRRFPSVPRLVLRFVPNSLDQVQAELPPLGRGLRESREIVERLRLIENQFDRSPPPLLAVDRQQPPHQ